jgi:hypothetical protein
MRAEGICSVSLAQIAFPFHEKEGLLTIESITKVQCDSLRPLLGGFYRLCEESRARVVSLQANLR